MISDFASPKDLAEYLIKLNNNDDLYEEYLTHRTHNKITNPHLQKHLNDRPWKVPKGQEINYGHFMVAQYSCHVCDQIHERNDRLKAHLKVKSCSVCC